MDDTTIDFGLSGGHPPDESVEDSSWLHEREEQPLVFDVIPPTRVFSETVANDPPDEKHWDNLPLTDEQSQVIDAAPQLAQRENFTVYVSEQPSERIDAYPYAIDPTKNLPSPFRIVDRIPSRKSVTILNRNDDGIASGTVLLGNINGQYFPLAQGAAVKISTKAAVYAIISPTAVTQIAQLAIFQEFED